MFASGALHVSADAVGAGPITTALTVAVAASDNATIRGTADMSPLSGGGTPH